MDESPPVTLCFSSTTTLAPAREASTAALMPATPLPTMTKSTSLVSCFSAGVSAAAWMVSGFWAPVALDVLLALAASEPLSALAGAAVLCGAQPARPLPATTAAVAPSPIRNERRETPADAMFFPSVLMMILPVRRCFLSAADPPPVDPLSPSCQGTGSPRQRQSGWIAKTLHSGGAGFFPGAPAEDRAWENVREEPGSASSKQAAGAGGQQPAPTSRCETAP